MNAATTIAETVAVIAARNQVQQPAGRPVVGVIIDGEHPAESIDARGVRIPESSRPQGQVAAVRSATKDASAFAAPRMTSPIGADQSIVEPHILSQADIQISQAVHCQPCEPVVGVVAPRVEVQDHLPAVGLAVVVDIGEMENIAPSHDKDTVAEACGDAHCVDKAVRERVDPVRLAVLVVVAEHENAVAGIALVRRLPMVRIALDGPDAAAGIDIDACGCDDLGRFGEQPDSSTRIKRPGGGVGRGRKWKPE